MLLVATLIATFHDDFTPEDLSQMTLPSLS